MPPLPITDDDLSDQLLARKAGTDDYSISVQATGGRRLPVGRIMLVARASGRVAWFWTITGPAAPDAGIELAGEAQTLDEAKTDLRQAFDRLLCWAAMARSGELRWYSAMK
jgi:hypothetical protein